MVKVKICGITNLRDAEAAAGLGADALGFVFAPSPREATPREVQAITARLGPYVTTVGVFVNATADRILKVASACRLDALQLHGEESPDFCRKLAPYKLIKTFRAGLFAARAPGRYPVDAYLFETPGPERGGTGRTWDWTRLEKRRFARPIIVSGGLNPSNVRRAVRALAPYAVDVSSGVEKEPGRKDPELMEQFIRHAKETGL